MEGQLSAQKEQLLDSQASSRDERERLTQQLLTCQSQWAESNSTIQVLYCCASLRALSLSLSHFFAFLKTMFAFN